MIGRKEGFSLIELIMTIIILSLSMMVIIPFFTGVTRSVDPMIRERAIALGQSMMDEILAKKWDNNTPLGGGAVATSTETPGPLRNTLAVTGSATAPASLTFEAGDGETAQRTTWDDVDDYHYLNHGGGNYENGTFTDQDGNAVAGNWSGFKRWVEVDYIASDSPVINQSSPASSPVTTDSKRIVVIVETPTGERLTFVSISCNI